MDKLKKAELERAVAKHWFDCASDAEEARAVAASNGLSWAMIEYWYGVEYRKADSASNGY